MNGARFSGTRKRVYEVQITRYFRRTDLMPVDQEDPMESRNLNRVAFSISAFSACTSRRLRQVIAARFSMSAVSNVPWGCKSSRNPFRSDAYSARDSFLASSASGKIPLLSALRLLRDKHSEFVEQRARKAQLIVRPSGAACTKLTQLSSCARCDRMRVWLKPNLPGRWTPRNP